MNVAALTVNALAAADAEDSALLKEAREIFQPLSMEVEVPSDPALKEQIELGQLLFFDPRMTIDADVSCSSCHQPSRYGTDGLSKSIGVSQRPHPRNAPTVLNAALKFIIYWRGDREYAHNLARVVWKHGNLPLGLLYFPIQSLKRAYNYAIGRPSWGNSLPPESGMGTPTNWSSELTAWDKPSRQSETKNAVGF